MHPAELDTDKLLRSCETRRGRRSGPGGQHRNKVETAIVLVHQPTGIRAEATERRSQHENHCVAVRRLKISLALGVRCQRDEATVPSTRWSSRCANRRIHINPAHEDFPAMLAEALDVVAANDFDVTAAASRLSINTSQLVRFLQIEPRAFLELNRQRQSRGLKPLR